MTNPIKKEARLEKIKSKLPIEWYKFGGGRISNELLDDLLNQAEAAGAAKERERMRKIVRRVEINNGFYYSENPAPAMNASNKTARDILKALDNNTEDE